MICRRPSAPSNFSHPACQSTSERTACDWSTPKPAAGRKARRILRIPGGWSFVLTNAPPEELQVGLTLQASIAGVLAIGEVRAGSTKRVAAAVGEGPALVAPIHTFLANSERR